MGRPQRVVKGGWAYHVLNRANGRMPLFEDADDYAAFERIMWEACERVDIRLLTYCLMPNHWHMVVWPRRDGDLSRFVGWLTLTHTQRYHAHHDTAGRGHVYQGRFKSFPIQRDDHLLSVCRYVERNASRAGLVERAEAWQWSGLWRRRHAKVVEQVPPLAEWPIEGAPDRQWLRRVNRPQTAEELEALRRSVNRGSPYGDTTWTKRTAQRLNLQSTLRPRGRPKQAIKGS